MATNPPAQGSQQEARPTFGSLVASSVILEIGKILSKEDRLNLCLASKKVTQLFRKGLSHVLWKHIVFQPASEIDAVCIVDSIHLCCDLLRAVKTTSFCLLDMRPRLDQPTPHIFALYRRFKYVLGRAPLQTVRVLQFEHWPDPALTPQMLFGNEHSLSNVEEISMTCGSQEILDVFPDTKAIFLRSRYVSASGTSLEIPYSKNPIPLRHGVHHPAHGMLDSILDVIDAIGRMTQVSALRIDVPVSVTSYAEYFNTITPAKAQYITSLSINTQERIIDLTRGSAPILTMLHRLTGLQRLRFPYTVLRKEAIPKAPVGFGLTVNEYAQVIRASQRNFVRICHWFLCLAPTLTTLKLGSRRAVVFESVEDDEKRMVRLMTFSKTDDGSLTADGRSWHASFDEHLSYRLVVVRHRDLAPSADQNDEQWERTYLL